MTVQPAGTTVDYVVTYLEMTARPRFPWPHLPVNPAATLFRAKEPPVWWFRALYDAVGRDYAWEDVPELSDETLSDWLDPDRMRLWTLMAQGWPHGFFLLDERAGDETDLTYFGLVPQAVGRGLGTFLLKTAILTAWEREGLARLTVNTCTLDHPRALSLYQKHGFRPVRREEKRRTLTRDRDTARIPA